MLFSCEDLELIFKWNRDDLIGSWISDDDITYKFIFDHNNKFIVVKNNDSYEYMWSFSINGDKKIINVFEKTRNSCGKCLNIFNFYVTIRKTLSVSIRKKLYLKDPVTDRSFNLYKLE